jgi:hypothetical protein
LEGWEEEEEEAGAGAEPRTWEGPLKDGAEEEVTFFMRSFILSFIMAAAGGGEVWSTAEEGRRLVRGRGVDLVVSAVSR